MSSQQQGETNKVSILIELEQSVRRAQTLQSLKFLIVNQTRQLIDYDQCIFLSTSKGSKPKADTVSGSAAVEKTSPLIAFVEKTARNEIKKNLQNKRHIITHKDMSEKDKSDWNELSPPNILWLPLIAPQKGLTGILWIAKQSDFTQSEYLLLDHMALTYAHGLQVFQKNNPFKALSKPFLKPLSLLIPIIIILIMFIRVNLTALGSVEIIPKKPYVVTSPLDGVVEKIIVESNQKIYKGDIVAELDDTELENNVSIAEKSLGVAKAQLEKTRRGAFINRESKQLIAELEANVDLRKAELDFVIQKREKTLLKAAKSGVAVVNRPDEWKGKPVRVGEKIFLIADPNEVEVEIMLPVKDSILLKPGNLVVIFLDSSPLTPKKAKITRTEYLPYITDINTLSYRVIATLNTDTNTPRIGLRGTAKIYGKKVSLFYYLFRRPITSLRQLMGW